MRQINFKTTEQQIEDMDALVYRGLYVSRNDVIRSAIRDLLLRDLWILEDPATRARQAMEL